ncbi:MAG TPA: DUF1570 domain-containing protein, partial [Thermoanaerobaculia bacterium]|nr:DUF1570 domain-containing protein [Thermoanaerobaculia bacterium]
MAAEAQEPRPTNAWVVVKAAEFEVYSNAGERAAMNVAEDLLLMRTVLGKVAKMNTTLSGPTRVLVFRDTKSFATVANALFGGKANKSGIYASRGDLRLIAIDASTIGARQIAYHELVHQYANATWSYLPVWFNEGIAEFYSNFGVDAHKAFVGRPNMRHVRWMRRVRPIPMREFLLADERSRWYTSTLDQQRFYAQSWAFVHYLTLVRRGELETFRTLLEQKKPLDDAFAEAFHASYEELTRQLLVYVRRPTLQSLAFPMDTLAIESIPRAEPSSEEEVNVHIA